MSRVLRSPERTPLIALVNRANRELQTDMVRHAHRRGWTGAKYAHNWVFGFLGWEGARASDLAAKAGITRQSMGEVVRDLVDLGIVEMTPDPSDRRAKLVTFTELGREEARQGYDHIVDFEERMTSELGPEAYEHLRLGLAKICELLEEAAED
jgi:DNA-binding MarR family transcriptional regulator